MRRWPQCCRNYVGAVINAMHEYLPHTTLIEGYISIAVGVIPLFRRGAGVICPEAQSNATAEVKSHSRCKKKHAVVVSYKSKGIIPKIFNIINVFSSEHGDCFDLQEADVKPMIEPTEQLIEEIKRIILPKADAE